MSIDIDKVFVNELEREISMLEKIKSANLDDTLTCLPFLGPVDT